MQIEYQIAYGTPPGFVPDLTRWADNENTSGGGGKPGKKPKKGGDKKKKK